MEEIIERLASIEFKLDALISALAEGGDELGGDAHGIERDTTQTL